MNIIIGVVIGVCITKIYINIKNYLEFKRLFKQANEILKIIDEQIEEHELQNKVLLVLEKYEETRSDDFKLYFHVCRAINENVAIMDRFSYVMLNHKELGFPSFESVTRCRRKIFEKYPNLKPKKVTKFREEKEEEFKEYARK